MSRPRPAVHLSIRRHGRIAAVHQVVSKPLPDRRSASAARRSKALDAIEAVCGSLPGSADRIRRRFWRDPEFRTVCEDYRDALQVLATLDRARTVDTQRVSEYRQLAAELLAEIGAMLTAEQS